MAQVQIRRGVGEKKQQELPSVLVYMADKRGQMLVESFVLGAISDISGSEKFVVIRDELNDACVAYRVVSSRDTLDAVAILPFQRDEFEARLRVTVEGEIYKLSPSADAMALLRNKRRWIQDAGCALGVLIEAAAQRRVVFTSRRIQRPRLTGIPDNAPIQSLAEQHRLLAQQRVDELAAADGEKGDEEAGKED